MTKKLIQHLLVLLLLAPLLFINIKNSHDWGDDFAQYIHQSQNIINGSSQNNTGTIFNDTYFIGPIAYPIGFPLLLTPVISVFGYDLVALNVYISLFLLLSCYLAFIFFIRNFSFLTSLFTTLIVAYNPIILSLKTEILSDLPYLFFSLLSILLIISRETIFRSIFLGIIIALSVHIRSVGFILLLIYFLSEYFKYKKNKQFKWKSAEPFLYGFSSFLIFFIALKLVFPCETNYPFPFEIEHFWQNINDHLSYNFENLFAFFKNNNSFPYNYLGLIAASTLIAFSIAGMILAIKTRKNQLVNYYVLIYIFVIICFKFGEAGLRFIIPILFFIFYYSILGVYKTFENTVHFSKWLPIILGMLVLFSFKTDFIKTINTTNDITEGPEKPDAKKMFDYINSNLNKTDIIEFEKPRVIALYTKVRSVVVNPMQSDAELKNDFIKYKANYILVHYILTSDSIKQYTKNTNNNCTSLLKLNDLELFKIN